MWWQHPIFTPGMILRIGFWKDGIGQKLNFGRQWRDVKASLRSVWARKCIIFGE